MEIIFFSEVTIGPMEKIILMYICHFQTCFEIFPDQKDYEVWLVDFVSINVLAFVCVVRFNVFPGTYVQWCTA